MGRIREEKRGEESRGEEKQKEKDILGTTLLSLLHQSGKAGVFSIRKRLERDEFRCMWI